MLSKFIRQIFPSPEMDEQEKKTVARNLQTIVIVSMLGAALSFLAAFVSGTIQARVIMAGLFLLLAVSLYALRNGTLLPAQILTPTALFATVTYLVITGNGLHDASFFGYAGVIIVASLTLGQGAAFVIAGLIILTSWGIGAAELNGLLVSPGSGLTDISTPVFITILVLAITFTQRTLINRMNESLQRARLNEQKQIDANKDLIELQRTLEKRVEERTSDVATRSNELEIANAKIQRRAAQFEALAQVTQTITAIRDVQILLPNITSVISEKFDFYHVGIFLLDEINQFAILSAANSEGGKRMLARNHRLRIGEEGIVGYAAATGKPRIAMDVGEDAVFFNNLELTNTHSEMALPLISKNIIIGVLDVQSTELEAFTNEDIQMLSLLADQVSLAIENARLFDGTRKALSESEIISRRAIRETWNRLPEQQKLLGYRYNVTGASPLKELIKFTESNLSQDKNNGTETIQAVTPIELRGEVIGKLIVQSPTGSKWNNDQLDLIKAVAERVALSAENARLFEETTARAEREKLVSDITSKIRSHNDPQAMIQTAITELREALGASRVEVIPQSIKGSERNEG
ncbi:MAG: GAF domain-containing protein [Chloroflexota bacterium]